MFNRNPMFFKHPPGGHIGKILPTHSILQYDTVGSCLLIIAQAGSCQDILPAVKISSQLSRYPASCQDIQPAVKICCQLSRYPASCEVHVACWRLLQARRAGSPPGGGGGQRRWGAGAAGGVHAPPPHPTPRNSSESVVKTLAGSWILLFRKVQYSIEHVLYNVYWTDIFT